MNERREVYKKRFGQEMRGEIRAWAVALAVLAVIIAVEVIL